MKQQVVFIHGGESFSSYDVYIECLKKEQIDPFVKKEKRWHQLLGEVLGNEYEFFTPSMPNSKNAKYLEWKIWFEKYIPFLYDGVILTGHSQGGYFLSKYLVENKLPVTIKALFLVGAVFNSEGLVGEDGGDFSFDTQKLGNVSLQVPHIYICHSEDDFVVPFSHAEKYQEKLPQATLLRFTDRNHFLQMEFPELIDLITKLK
jgi:uncharacterized protein